MDQTAERQIGALHIHSTYSADGRWPLERCKEVFQQDGYHFLAMTEHAEGLDREKREAWLSACEALSDRSFVIIPGLEFSVGPGIHLLGFGVTRPLRGPSIAALVDQIHEAGGVAVWAHPSPAALNMIYPCAGTLDGMEIWNGRYHGVQRPSLQLLRGLERLRERHPHFHGFAGIDFHEGDQDRRISVAVASARSGKEILAALRAGQFTIRRDRLAIPATGVLSFRQQVGIALGAPFLWRESDACPS
ncbi:MAG: hypothetical protein HY282_02000 [Nitrospirae bacterium]|nr:hypothetical protein [Candidatus Manganitrophaceae bacterium]